MSCYFRHLKEMLAEGGITLTPANKKQVDQAIHQLMDVSYKNCPETWKRLKQQIIGDELKRRAFAAKLRGRLT